MRVALALAVTAALLCVASVTRASQARAALDRANAALAAEPPRREQARLELLRATAADDDPPAVGEAFFVLGQLDEARGRFAEALEDDRAAVEAAPSTRWSLRASDRADWLRARSEGEFGPLARLEAVRRDASAASDPAAIDALAHDLESFPPGQVRVEARMLVAEAWLGRMHRPEDAIGELRQVVDDAKADVLTGRLAERQLVDALIATGRVDEAAAEARAHASRLDPRFVKQVGRLVIRARVRVAAIATLGAFVALAAWGLVRAAQRRQLGTAGHGVRAIAPVAFLFVAFVAVAGGILASNYESGNASPFLWLGAAVLPLVLVARAWSAVGSPRPGARVARATLSGGAVVAAAFVVLDALDPQYLSGFGL
jgi:tetratricopeptide (TPR) repeat protein